MVEEFPSCFETTNNLTGHNSNIGLTIVEENMSRKYWLHLYTGETWMEFLKNGSTVTGFKECRSKTVEKVSIGDYMICYVTGISVFIGVLEVKSKSFFDTTRIWEKELFPYRFKVEVLYKLDPNTAIPVKELRNILSIFIDIPEGGSWTGFFRGAPRTFKGSDGEIIFNKIKSAVQNPLIREIDEKKYHKSTKLYSAHDMEVTIPDEIENHSLVKNKNRKMNHSESDNATHNKINGCF